MKWAIYARTAQVDERSVSEQEKCARQALKKNDEVAGVYTDNGYSGVGLNRPALKQLLKDAKEGKFQGVIISRIDRLGRSCANVRHLLQQLERDNIVFKSATEPYDTSQPVEKLSFALMTAFADYERQMRYERRMEKLI